MISFFSLKSWFVSERKTKLSNDESCWLIFDEYLFILFKFPIVINGDDVGLWSNNDDDDDVDDTAEIFIRFDNCVNSTDEDLFVIDELEFSIIAVWWWWWWWKLDDDGGVSRLTKFINIQKMFIFK